MSLILLVALISPIPVIVLLLLKWRYSYWKRKGVFQLPGDKNLIYGDLRNALTGKCSMGHAFREIYLTFKKRKLRFGGVYMSFKLQFLPIDVVLIKDIMQKSFSHFQDRGLYHNENDILTENLFRMEGEPWKNLRVKLTPTFTSNRMRNMFETLLEKALIFEHVVDQCVNNGGRANVTDMCSRFTTDVIGSCAFGIECDSLQNAECDFRVYGAQINKPRASKQWLEHMFPKKLLWYTGFRSFPHLDRFFTDIVLQTIEYRKNNNIFRKDFMHLLLQLRNRGVLSDDSQVLGKKNETGILTDAEIVAQCFIFFVAGFDTSSATMAFALYELAKHPEIQDKMREEIRQVYEKHNGKLTYDGTKELIYTEQVISETLRKYPIVHSIPRVCTKRYRIPDSKVVLEKGTPVQISVWGLHMDPEYYPNPEVFDPNRFTEEEKAKRPDFSYLPFGEGPRVCIGARFADLQMKAGLAEVIKGHKFSLLPETPQKLNFKAFLILLHPDEDFYLRVEKI